MQSIVGLTASVHGQGYFLEQGTDTFERTMRLNYLGSVFTAKAAVPAMVRAPSWVAQFSALSWFRQRPSSLCIATIAGCQGLRACYFHCVRCSRSVLPRVFELRANKVRYVSTWCPFLRLDSSEACVARWQLCVVSVMHYGTSSLALAVRHFAQSSSQMCFAHMLSVTFTLRH